MAEPNRFVLASGDSTAMTSRQSIPGLIGSDVQVGVVRLHVVVFHEKAL